MVNMEKPEEFNEVVGEFLSNRVRPGFRRLSPPPAPSARGEDRTFYRSR